MKNKLTEMQKQVDEKFAKNDYKLNDEILQMQIDINKLRNEENIPDETEITYQKYVQ